MTTLLPRLLWLSLGFVLALVGAAHAQCTTQWLPGDGVPGVVGEVRSMVMRDPDGAGPLLPRVVVGGQIEQAGERMVQGVAEWDPTTETWAPLGAGLPGVVNDLLVLPNGDLLAAGHFASGSGPAPFEWVVARWDGTSWTPLGFQTYGFETLGTACALALLTNGDIAVGGTFGVYDAAWNLVAGNLAVWNGTSWSSLGYVDSAVYDLVVMPNGDLVAMGPIWTIGGVVAQGLARWDGSNWSPLGTTVAWLAPVAIALLPNGHLVVAGDFAPLGLATDLASWDGTAWTALPGTNGWVEHLLVLANGDLLASGSFSQVGGVSAGNVARWNGAAWSSVVPGGVLGMLLGEDGSGGLLFHVAYGALDIAAGIARWDGASWSSLGSGNMGSVAAFASTRKGDLIAGGSFTRLGGVLANRIARWNGTTWSPLGSGVNGLVRALAVLPNDHVIACGDFTVAGGVPVNGIARWDGTNWSAVPWTMSGTLRALAVLPSGDLVLGGDFQTPFALGVENGVVRWDGAAWHGLRNGVYGSVHALLVLANGDLIVGGSFVEADRKGFGPSVSTPRVARWDGSVWSGLDTGVGWAVHAITVLPDGDLVVTGAQPSGTPYGISRWNGATWTPIAGVSSRRAAVLALPNGDIVAGGSGFGSPGLERWEGGSWTPLATAYEVEAMHLQPDGVLFVGGTYMLHGNTRSWGMARLATTCPPATVAFGAGCAGVGSTTALVPTTMPWVDGTFRALGTGLPRQSLVLGITGFLPLPSPLPLANLLPQAVPGCNLLVAIDGVQVLSSNDGTAESSLFVPSAPPIVGLTFCHQMVAFDLDAASSIVSVVSTNALKLTVGQF